MENNKLIIKFFGQKHVPSREGGVEIVVEELAVRMSAAGHDITCINRRSHHVSGKQYDLHDLKEYKNIKIISVPTIEKKGLAAASAALFSSVIVAFGKCDIVHIHAEGSAAFCWFPKLFGKKVIVTCHGLDWKRPKWQDSFGGKFIKYGEKTAVKYADEIIVLNNHLQTYFMDEYGRKTTIIPNGIEKFSKKKANLIIEKWGLNEGSYMNAA